MEDIPLSLNVGTAHASACLLAAIQPETHDVPDQVVHVDFTNECERAPYQKRHTKSILLVYSEHTASTLSIQ